jgi:hypothetical protein
MRTSDSRRFLALVFQAAQTTQPDFFERSRGILPPAVAIMSILVLTSLGCRTGYEGVMVTMFTAYGATLGWTNVPAASSFCRAREKITQAMFEAFRTEVLRLAQPTIHRFLPRIRGHRVVAVDGSWISVPNSKLLRKLLGIHHIGPKRCPMGKPQVLLVVLTDALTRMPIAWAVLPGTGSEREAAKAMLTHLRSDDILVADRGYQGREMLALIHATGCRYALRVSGGTGAWNEVRQLQRRRCRDSKVQIFCKNFTINVRHLRISGGPGRPRRHGKRETIYLITNLPAAWSIKRAEAIYRCRWGVETMFRELKCTLETNRIAARSLPGVIQELEARCLHLTLAAILDMATLIHHRTGNRFGQPTCQTNRTVLLLIIAIAIVQGNDPDILDRCAIAAETEAQRAQRIRLGRRAPRGKAMFE